MDKLRSDIKNKRLNGVYLFTGEEKYLVKAYENSFIKACLPDGHKDIGLSVFEGKSATPYGITDAADTPSFTGGSRLVLIKDSGLFTAKRKDDGEKISDYLKERYGDGGNGNAVILFVEGDVDKRGKAYKAVNKLGQVTEFKTPSESEMATWIKETFRRSGMTVSPPAAVHLIRICGGNMEAVSKEIEKLISYKKEGQVTKEDMDALCTRTPESRLFDLVDAISAKNRGGALTIYNELISMKEQPVGILAMMSRQLSLILKSGLLSKKGSGEREIAEKLGQHPYSVKIAVSQSKRIPEGVLRQAVLDCADCDINIKTGKIDAKLGVEMIIIKYTG